MNVTAIGFLRFHLALNPGHCGQEAIGVWLILLLCWLLFMVQHVMRTIEAVFVLMRGIAIHSGE